MTVLEKCIETAWLGRGWLACLLWPLSLVYRSILSVRRFAYRVGWKRIELSPLPVVVVGNLSVGGTGKTPLCAYLVDHFRQKGWRPAIVSRGYGGQQFDTPHTVNADDTAEIVGDEPLMLYEQTGVPVCVCVKRADAVRSLAANTDANIVISDDGLQHLAMSRVAQVLVVDAARGFGNLWLLPAGPLRDTAGSLDEIDLFALQRADNIDLHPSLSVRPFSVAAATLEHQSFSLVPRDAKDLFTGQCVELDEFAHAPVNALAGIGHPQRFFDALTQEGLQLIPRSFPDHHAFEASDMEYEDAAPVLVTSKDAVKLRSLVTRKCHVYEVRTDIRISSGLQQSIEMLERRLSAQSGGVN